VAKFVLSDGDYAARENTYRRFREEQRRKDPLWTLERELAQRRGVRSPCPTNTTRLTRRPQEALPAAPPAADEHHQAAEAALARVGDRCEVQPGGRRGAVAYVGNAPLPGVPPGYWVGVALDEPVGKHDGAVGGVRLFTCTPGHGLLVRPAALAVGDFPELDAFADEM
jgi:tubulin-folding cofactor B